MKRLLSIVLLLLPVTLGAKSDPLTATPEPNRTLLRDGIPRYAKDEIAQNWDDLYNIADQVGGEGRDYRFTDSDGVLPRVQFVSAIRNAIASGSEPVLKSFELTSIAATKEGYEVRACCKGERESFHFKGIIAFRAIIKDGTAQFGQWSYVVNSPHSCDQKQDSQI